VRVSVLLIVLLSAACHGGSRSSDSTRVRRVGAIDSATAHRICESPDSVLAGTKDCVLRDQGRRPDRREWPTVPAPAPR
jgi:hypothetical protein